MDDAILEPIDEQLAELLLRAARPRASVHDEIEAVAQAHRLKSRQRKRLRELFQHAQESAVLVERALAIATPNGIAHALREGVRAMMVRVLAGDLSPRVASRRLPWIDWGRVRGMRDEVAQVDDPVARIVAVASLPVPVARRLVRDHGEDAVALATALVGRAPLHLRANRALCTRERLALRLAREGVMTVPCRLAPHGLVVVGSAQLFATEAFRDGWFEVQDEGSQLVAELVDPPQDGVVLDACAGAGGKTLAIAAAMRSGELLAIDVDAPRLAELRRRARRARVDWVTTERVEVNGWPDAVAEFAARADRILVDAPCSGLGALRRHPEARAQLDERDFALWRAVQTALLERALRALKPGARAIYATCSVLFDENDGIVEAALANVGGVARMPVRDLPGDGTALRALPHRDGTDGFYATVLVKTESGEITP